jgi:hypothetical protein
MDCHHCKCNCRNRISPRQRPRIADPEYGCAPEHARPRDWKLLLARVEDFAYAHGYKRLILNTTPFMNRAIRLYEAFGFRFTGSKWNWFGTWLRPMKKELAGHTKD